MTANKKAVDHTGLFDGYPAPEKYTPPNADKELAAELNSWFEDAYQHRLPYEWSWDLNRLFLRGDQLLGRHKITGSVIRLSSEDSKKLRSQNNVLRPISRSLVGKLCRLIPTYTVNPATSDFEEQNGAQVADMILQYVRRKEDLDSIYTALCEYLPWAGNSFVELSWDYQSGRLLAFCEVCKYFLPDESLIGQPCPQCAMVQEQGQQEALMAAMEAGGGMVSPEEIMEGMPEMAEVPRMTEANEGDVKAIVRDPRDVFLPAGCTDIKYASRICVRELVEVPEAKRRFPDFAAYIYPDSLMNMDKAVRHRLSMSEQGGGSDQYKDHVYIKNFKEKPTEAYPKGRDIFMVNDVIVKEVASLYSRLKRFPVYHFGFDKLDGELYCDAFITQAWHRQRELNRLETQMTEHTDQVLKPKLMNPLGTRVSADEFTAATAQVIDYNALAGEPHWQVVPDLAQGVWSRKQDVINDIRTLASVTEAEQGVMGTDPNGRASAIMNAEADQQVGPIVQRNNAEWRELHRGIVILYQQYAHADRVATIAGPEGSETFSFGDLALLQDGWDIQMEQEEGLSRNPQVRLTQAMSLAQMGYFMDPGTGLLDKQGFARYAKLKAPDAGYNLQATERAAAASIPQLLKNGIPWQPRIFDDPVIFQEVLAGWLRGPGRRGDQMLSQQVEQIWMYYVQWAMTGAQPQGPGMGPTGGPGEASQPGSEMSAPGGEPNSSVEGEAAAQVQGADQYGEDLANTDAQQ